MKTKCQLWIVVLLVAGSADHCTLEMEPTRAMEVITISTPGWDCPSVQPTRDVKL